LTHSFVVASRYDPAPHVGGRHCDPSVSAVHDTTLRAAQLRLGSNACFFGRWSAMLPAQFVEQPFE
jgi:hypothetical protein